MGSPNAGGTVEVTLSGGYRYPQLDRLVSGLQPLLTLDEPANVRLDMGGLVFIGPSALALLLAALKRLDARGLLIEGRIVPPRSRQTYNYLLRMDVLKALRVPAPARRFTRKAAVGFRPCQQITPDGDYPKVAWDLSKALCESCGATDAVTNAAVYISMHELAENVVQHAATPVGGFVAAQGWRRRQEIEIGFVDLGVGIRGSLRKNPEYADIGDDVAAITKAVKPRVTSTPKRNSGIGLFIMRELLNANGGSLYIRSGNGCVTTSSWVDNPSVSDVELPGTVVVIRARTDRALNLRQVYKGLTRYDHHSSDHDPAG